MSELYGVIVGGMLATAGGFLANWYSAKLTRQADALKLKREKLEEFAKLTATHDGEIDLKSHMPPHSYHQLHVLAGLYFPELLEKVGQFHAILQNRAVLLDQWHRAGDTGTSDLRNTIQNVCRQAEVARVELLKAQTDIAKKLGAGA